MNTKFLSAILFGALMVTSTGTFVSCKDYDDDIDSLQGQVDTNVSAIDALKSQLSSLQTAGSAAQATADAAKAAADAAKKAGDDAKAAAEEAKAAAAQAKADAIAEAANQVAALKAIVEANKLSQDQLQTLIATVSGKVEAIDADINELKGLVTTKDGKTLADIAAVVADLEEQVAALQAGGVASEEITGLIESLQGQLNTVTGSVWTLIEDVDVIMTAIAGNQENVDAAIADLNQRLANSYGELDELWAEINGEGANSIRTQMGQLANLINELQVQYNTLSVLVAPQLGSLTFIPQAIIDGVEGLTFGSFEYYALTLNKKNTKDEIAVTAQNATVVNPVVKAQYHVSPKNVDIESIKDKLNFVYDDVPYITSRVASEGFEMVPTFDSYDAKTGILTVKVDIKGVPATKEDITLFALQVDSANINVTSDYATLMKTDMDDIAIADEKTAADNHYRRAIIGIDGKDTAAKLSTVKAWSDTNKDVLVDTSFVYTGSLDLKTIVKAHALDTVGTCLSKDAKIEDLGFTWKFEVVENYVIGTDSETPQDKFVALNDGVLTAKVYDTTGRAAIGRTPIIRVYLMHGNAIVKCSYIKVRIVDTPDAPVDDESIEMTVAPFEFTCTGDSISQKVSEEVINKQIYNKLGLSFEQFTAKYPYFQDYGKTLAPAEIGEVTSTKEQTGSVTEATDIVTWTLSSDELWNNAGKAISHKVRYYANADFTGNYVQFVLTSSIKDVQKEYNLDKTKYILNYWDNNDNPQYAKFNVTVPEAGETDSTKCLFINDLNSPFVTWDATTAPDPDQIGSMALDKNVSDIQYYFCKDVVAGIKKIGNIDVVFSVSADGLALLAKVDNVTDTIAKIANDSTVANAYGTMTYQNAVTYNKDSEIAKQLLNTGEMKTYIGATGYVCGKTDRPVSIKFKGEDHFQANFIRPVNIETKAADNFVDGVDFGEDGSYIEVKDLINPYDWRSPKRYFNDAKYANYWDYYGKFNITVDTESVMCSLNAEAVTAKEITLADGSKVKAIALPTTLEFDQVATIATVANPDEFGYVTYKNNGTKVDYEFNIYVKVKVDYGWGTIYTDYITVLVKPTITEE